MLLYISMSRSPVSVPSNTNKTWNNLKRLTKNGKIDWKKAFVIEYCGTHFGDYKLTWKSDDIQEIMDVDKKVVLHYSLFDLLQTIRDRYSEEDEEDPLFEIQWFDLIPFVDSHCGPCLQIDNIMWYSDLEVLLQDEHKHKEGDDSSFISL